MIQKTCELEQVSRTGGVPTILLEKTAQLEGFGFVHQAHAALADQREHFV